jgi:hypothetical protein
MCKVITTLFYKTNSANQTQDSKQLKNFRHVSAGPQPIFGLAVGLRGLGAARMKHAGPPGPGGCYEMPETYSPTASLIFNDLASTAGGAALLERNRILSTHKRFCTTSKNSSFKGCTILLIFQATDELILANLHKQVPLIELIKITTIICVTKKLRVILSNLKVTHYDKAKNQLKMV